MSSGNEYNIQLSNVGSILKLVVSGQVNENFKFDNLELSGAPTVHIDLDGINLMNSSGVKRWFKFIEAIPAESDIIYQKVPPIIVTQMNIVEGFLSNNATVESFYAPYFDESKDQEVKKLLKPSEIVNKKAPIIKNEDGDELEFDALEETYFKFLDKL